MGDGLDVCPLKVVESEVIRELVVPAQIPGMLLVEHGSDVFAGGLTVDVPNAQLGERPLGARTGDDVGALNVPETVGHGGTSNASSPPHGEWERAGIHVALCGSRAVDRSHKRAAAHE